MLAHYSFLLLLSTNLCLMFQKSPMIKQDFKQDLSKLMLNISYKYDIKLSRKRYV